MCDIYICPEFSFQSNVMVYNMFRWDVNTEAGSYSNTKKKKMDIYSIFRKQKGQN